MIEPRTPEQKAETIAQWEAAGRSCAEAARRLDVHVNTFKCRLHVARGLQLVRVTTARDSEDNVTATHTVERPDRGECVAEPLPGFAVSRRTVHRVGGEITQTWEQERPGATAFMEGFAAHVERLASRVTGLAPFVPAPSITDADLLTVYPLGDPHFGLYAHAPESGDDFDLATADRITRAAIDRLVMAAPAAETGLLLNLGDYYHADSSSNMTPGSGNPLDVDTRYGKVMEVGAMAMIHCTERLLQKHKTVIVWNLPGNHDPHASFALALAMQMYFRNEPRVTVSLSTSLYRYHEFGLNLIGGHHGHGAKGADLPLLMANDADEAWGRTKFRVFHCGHIHHQTLKESPGCTVETHRTLAAKDAWHAGKGYRSGRDAKVITYHRQWGEIQRTRCDVSMLEAA